MVASALIPKRVTSANAHVINAGASRWRYAKERDEWSQWIAVKLRVRGQAGNARRVTFERRYAGRQREMDLANMVAGLKSCVDAMVRAGLLVDDSPRWLDDRYEQRRVETEAECGLVITIEEVE